MVVLVQHVVLSGSWFGRVGVGLNLLVVRTRGGPCCVLVFVVRSISPAVGGVNPMNFKTCSNTKTIFFSGLLKKKPGDKVSD